MSGGVHGCCRGAAGSGRASGDVRRVRCTGVHERCYRVRESSRGWVGVHEQCCTDWTECTGMFERVHMGAKQVREGAWDEMQVGKGVRDA